MHPFEAILVFLIHSLDLQGMLREKKPNFTFQTYLVT